MLHLWVYGSKGFVRPSGYNPDLEEILSDSLYAIVCDKSEFGINIMKHLINVMNRGLEALESVSLNIVRLYCNEKQYK